MTAHVSVRCVFAAVVDMMAILVIITAIFPLPVDGAFINAAPHLVTAHDLPPAGPSSRCKNVGRQWPVRSTPRSSWAPLGVTSIPGRSHRLPSATLLGLHGGGPDNGDNGAANQDDGCRTVVDSISDNIGTGDTNDKYTMMSNLTYSLIVGTIVAGAISVSSSPSDVAVLPLIGKSSGLIIAGISLIVFVEYGINGYSKLVPNGPKLKAAATTFSDWRSLATVYAVLAALIAGVTHFNMSQDAISLAASIRKEDQALAATIRREDKLDHQKERLDDRVGAAVAASVVVAMLAVARNEDKYERRREQWEQDRVGQLGRIYRLEDKISALRSRRWSLLLPWERAAIDREITATATKLESLRKMYDKKEY
jgi:hypothetical protein